MTVAQWVYVGFKKNSQRERKKVKKSYKINLITKFTNAI